MTTVPETIRTQKRGAARRSPSQEELGRHPNVAEQGSKPFLTHRDPPHSLSKVVWPWIANASAHYCPITHSRELTGPQKQVVHRHPRRRIDEGAKSQSTLRRGKVGS